MLAYVDLTDIGFLSGLTGMEELYIVWVPLSDIRVLGTLGSLRTVELVGTNVVDILPLLALPNLQTFIIQETPARADVITELKKRGVTIK